MRVFRQKVTPEDAIGSHACSLQLLVSNDSPLECPLSYPFTLCNLRPITEGTMTSKKKCHTWCTLFVALSVQTGVYALKRHDARCTCAGYCQFAGTCQHPCSLGSTTSFNQRLPLVTPLSTDDVTGTHTSECILSPPLMTSPTLMTSQVRSPHSMGIGGTRLHPPWI